MPNRERVVETMVRDKMGRHLWHQLTGEHACLHAPDCGLPAHEHKWGQVMATEWAEADRVYVHVITHVDWNRVMMLAVDRHQRALAEDPDRHVDCGDLYAEGTGEDPDRIPPRMPCGDCIMEAALCLKYAMFHWDLPALERAPRERSVEEFTARSPLS